MTPPKQKVDWKTIILVASLAGFGTMMGEKAFEFARNTVKVVNNTPEQDLAIKTLSEQNTRIIKQNDTIIHKLENLDRGFVRRSFFTQHIRHDSARFSRIEFDIATLKQ